MQYAIDLFVNFIVFMMGSLFGSFYTLAIYRIPLKKNILNERSFCPNCKNKLGLLDLFPIFSFLFLRGKCRYCKNPIGFKYILIELFTAAMFIMFFNSLKFLEVTTFNELIINLMELFSFMLFFTFMFLVAFIDKEKYKIEENLLRFGIFISILYVLFTYILHTNVNYIYMLASSTALILLFIIYEILRDYKIRTRYYIQLVMFFVILSIYIPIRLIIAIGIGLIPIYILMYIVQKIILKREKKKESNDNVQIKVSLSEDNTKIFTVEKKQLVSKSATEGKSLRLRDLRLKNITDEIHIPFALLIGLISFILFILFKLF